jgi:soluble lytic murein transglycosylase-like protein
MIGSACHTGGKPFKSFPFLDALAMRESTNDPKAISPKGAVGLYQILPGDNGALNYYNTFNRARIKHTREDLFDPVINEKIAVFYLRSAFRAFDGCLVKVFNSYNMGFGNTWDGLYYLEYCRDILGDHIVDSFLKKYKAFPLYNKDGSQKRVFYVRKRIDNGKKNR